MDLILKLRFRIEIKIAKNVGCSFVQFGDIPKTLEAESPAKFNLCPDLDSNFN